jgi:SAM-dependent methyltransferase
VPFRETFECLWCGAAHTCRGPDDLEGWAQLCPECVGKAGDNGFLRFRLRQALTERGAAVAVVSPPAGVDAEMLAYYEARAPEYDDWYLRHGRYERGPIHDAAWNAELDAAGRWLDDLPIAGEIVELAAGTGWWSPLLASKGELWLYDAAESPLERARERLLAHGLRAHIHLRDAWAEPDRAVDAVVLGFWLSHVDRNRTGAFLELARRWLKPGGTLAIIDSLADPQSGAEDHPPVIGDRATRRVADGREFTIVKVHRDPAELGAALRAAGFGEVRVETSGRFFVLADARG